MTSQPLGKDETRFPAHDRVVECRRRLRQHRSKAAPETAPVTKESSLTAASGCSSFTGALLQWAQSEVNKA
jgi:hypothetical protein